MKKESFYVTLIFLCILVCINLWMVIWSNQPWFISSLNIFFHEAGHWIFGIFGEFIGVLGGMLGEMLMPGLFIYYFFKNNQLPGQVFSWWWLSTAVYDTSIYIADARAQVLEIIGGPGGHDWVYLLGRMNILEYDILISRIFIIGFLCITAYMVILIHRYHQQYLQNVLKPQ